MREVKFRGFNRKIGCGAAGRKGRDKRRMKNLLPPYPT